jgi:hypothetical protein
MKTHLTVPRTNLYRALDSTDVTWGNRKHFNEIATWCLHTFGANGWGGYLDSAGEKHFEFDQPENATLFQLRWLS